MTFEYWPVQYITEEQVFSLLTVVIYLLNEPYVGFVLIDISTPARDYKTQFSGIHAFPVLNLS